MLQIQVLSKVGLQTTALLFVWLSDLLQYPYVKVNYDFTHQNFPKLSEENTTLLIVNSCKYLFKNILWLWCPNRNVSLIDGSF